MAKPVVALAPDMQAGYAVRLLLRLGVGRAVVVDEAAGGRAGDAPGFWCYGKAPEAKAGSLARQPAGYFASGQNM